jgi:hypothetical protein
MLQPNGSLRMAKIKARSLSVIALVLEGGAILGFGFFLHWFWGVI